MPLDYKIAPGQYVKIYLNSVLRFTGIVNDTSTKKAAEGIYTLFQEVNCGGLNTIPSRRTVQANYAEGTTVSTIVTDIITDILSQEGITQGRIDNGSEVAPDAILLKEDWKDDCISVSDILDECAAKSGYQWFIDKNFALQFYRDTTISTSTNNLVDGGTFDDFRQVIVNETIDNYNNKCFVLGGNDDHGDQIFVIQGTLTQQNSQQLIAGGSGVYGYVHRDSVLTEHDYIIAEAGTSATTIYRAPHPFSTGDFFWNVTRDKYSIITNGTYDPDYATCESVPSQASGDTIECYMWPNMVGRNIINKQSFMPTIVDFKSYNTEFEPSDKIQISLSDVSVSGYFSIDELNIREVQACVFEAQIKAIYRDSANFSTQKNASYVEFFRGF